MRKDKMKYQLALQFPMTNEYAFDFLMRLENELIEILEKQHIVDGHDVGTSQMNMFIHTDNPNAAFAKAIEILKPKELQILKAAFRQINGNEYKVIWPLEYNGAFEIT
jgi:hypothetical protein